MVSVRWFGLVAMVGGLCAASGLVGTARAQASGTLQASATVLDDAVSRSVLSRLAPPPADAGDLRPSGTDPVELLRLETVMASLTELGRDGQVRRVRVEIVYLN